MSKIADKSKPDDASKPTNAKSLTKARLKRLVGSNLRKFPTSMHPNMEATADQYGMREFIRGYNQAKDEIRERIKNG